MEGGHPPPTPSPSLGLGRFAPSHIIFTPPKIKSWLRHCHHKPSMMLPLINVYSLSQHLTEFSFSISFLYVITQIADLKP